MSARLFAGVTAFASALILGFTAPAESRSERLPGIDVSRFDGRIDWRRVAAAGIDFAFVQASRGAGEDCAVKPRRCGRDGYYADNYRQARAAGLRVGAYHRAFTNGDGAAEVKADARAEARVFVGSVGELRDRDLLPVLDVETPFGDLDPHELRSWLRTWLGYVEDRLGAKPIIYTNTSSWSQTGDSTEFARAGYPLWVANWSVPTPLVPAANWAGNGWSIWQYTSSGSVPGIHGRVDRDWLRGGLRRLSVR